LLKTIMHPMHEIWRLPDCWVFYRKVAWNYSGWR